MKDKNKIEDKIFDALKASDDRALLYALNDYKRAGCDCLNFREGEGKLINLMAFHGCLYGIRYMEMMGEDIKKYPELLYNASSFYCPTRTIKEYCMCISHLCESEVGNGFSAERALARVEEFIKQYKNRGDANDADMRLLDATINSLQIQASKVDR